MEMRCGISGCTQELSFHDATTHYAQFHQKFTCDKCENIFFGVKNFSVHPSIECIQVIRKVDVAERKKTSKKPQNRNGKILDWLQRLSEADLDPASTFASLKVEDYDQEYCKKKIRFNNTDEAILTLIKIEKRLGEPVLQMPYRCRCKGVHNTHLISRRALKELITKYEDRIKKKSQYK